jgi:uncharacterized glyoxalase superfamily protein PhnB
VLAYIRYLSSFASVVVPDLDTAVSWYASAFGFEVIARDPHGSGGVPAVHMRRGEGQDVMLVAGDAGEAPVPGSSGVSLSLAVDGELARFVDNAVANGAQRLSRETPDEEGAGDVTLRDPYGHNWAFFARVAPGARSLGSRVHH